MTKLWQCHVCSSIITGLFCSSSSILLVNVQDLLRQLQQATRRMENGLSSSVNGKPVDSLSIGSVGSQDGSFGSLDTTGVVVSNCADLTPRVCVFSMLTINDAVIS